MRFDRDASAQRNNVLPSEKVTDAKAVMSGRIHRVERLMNAISRLIVSRCKIVLRENTGMPFKKTESIRCTGACAPRADRIRSVGAPLHDDFNGVVHSSHSFSLKSS